MSAASVAMLRMLYDKLFGPLPIVPVEASSFTLMRTYPFMERLNRKNSGMAAVMRLRMTGTSCWNRNDGM